MTPTKKATPIPTWLRQHLIDTGAWSADGCNRKASLRRHSCGLYVLYGLDCDLAAGTAVVDVQPLTVAGELGALMRNRRTYSYRHRIKELDLRTNLHMRSLPGSDPAVHVLAEHGCHSDPLPHFTPEPTPPKELNDECPF